MYIVRQYERAIELLLNFVSGYSTAERNLLGIRHIRDICFWVLAKRHLEYQTYLIPRLESTIALDNIKSICNRILSPNIISDAFSSESDISYIIAKIRIDLNIRDSFTNLLKDALLQIRRFYHSVHQISMLASVQVEQTNPKHCEMLEIVWKSLLDAPLPCKYSKSNIVDLNPGESSWGLLGFQKPFTDFRSTGYLGLVAMHHMSTIWTEETKSLLNDTNERTKWLPFAITSINVTWWLVEFMKDKSLTEYGCLNGFFYRSELDPLDIFNTLHTFTFFQFCYFWLNAETTSIMDFPRISLKFKRSISQFFREFTDSDVKDQKYINQIPHMIKVRTLML
ncbi:ELMO/CED-12 family [Babesia microti strain RI]|uniref:ELMO/CED-12 family n=1 Tax=Babesia microti (strain RI) TaxID=1133968 RepID=A0A1R4AB20_BABMR|nr:ELMO/CED-12 family [Babesia microti strain RI]SJK86206.1 ELMO/CED-12 family [Babesia microti strain RI]|eukprot:XP_021338394.1 ELMO/CED-12 family [Babesia microti strain RI]